VNWQNCISNEEAIRQTLFLEDLRQVGSPQTPQKEYETEFHVQERSQTGVWERAGKFLLRHCSQFFKGNYTKACLPSCMSISGSKWAGRRVVFSESVFVMY